MEPKKFGRTLGIGVRVASKVVRDRAAQSAQQGKTAARPAPAAPLRPQPAYAEKGRTLGQTARGVGRGSKRFGQSLWGPLAHAGGVLWLEVTGLFFVLFAAFFTSSAYRYRASWRGGAEHDHFLLYVILAAVFLWFAASSFLRARRKSQRQS